MHKLKSLSIIAILFWIVSCSNSDNNNQNTPTPDNNYTLVQSINNVQELDNVAFTISGSNTIGISNTTWYINDIQISSGTLLIQKSFYSSGNFIVKVKINYTKADGTPSITTIEKNVVVTDRPKNSVAIKKVEIMGYSYDNDFLATPLGYYMKTKFDIKELDDTDTNTSVLKYSSSENAQNWNGNFSMIYPMSWDISSANYNVKVYQSGNYYPNNQPNYNTEITVYAAHRVSGTQQPFIVINNLKLDLNQYRSLQPTTINVTNNAMQYKVTLQWN